MKSWWIKPYLEFSSENTLVRRQIMSNPVRLTHMCGLYLLLHWLTRDFPAIKIRLISYKLLTDLTPQHICPVTPPNTTSTTSTTVILCFSGDNEDPSGVDSPVFLRCNC